MDVGAQQPQEGPHRPVRTGRGVFRRVAVAMGVGMLVLSAIGSLAILSDSQLVPDGTLATASCFRARIGNVHSGTVTSSGDGTTSVTIPAVDPAASFVLHSVSAAGSGAGDGLVSVELTNSTTLDVVRRTTSTTAVTVAYHVVEYDCGVRVQRGVSTGSTAAGRDVTITPTDPARAFTTVAVAPGAGAGVPSASQQVTGTLTGPTTVRLEAGAAPASDARWVWQVVEFVRTADIDALHETVVLASADTTTTVTLPAGVDPSRTLLLAGVRTASGTLEQAAVTAEFTGDDQVTLRRTATGVAATVELQVIELLDGTAVQRGALTTADTATTETAALASPLDTTRATVLATGTGWGGAAATGRASAGADAIGRVLGRFSTDDASTVRVTRGRSDGSTTWTYQAVTWGGPTWWDLAYGSRERIEVATATTAAPDGYTVPLSFDHAAMVAAGGALASGDDVRVLRWDGSTWTELDRVLNEASAWDAADTTVWFRTATPIAADTTDISYWLYRGNAAAGAPPADPAQVFLAVEGFESGLGAFSERTTGTGWYAADDWSHRRPITIPAGSTSSDLADLPVLVSLTDPGMVGQVQADGSDLRFTAADGTTPLAHELERWDSATGELLAWVEVPTVAAGAATGLYLYWGATDAPDQADVRSTWSNGFAGVWHLAEDPTGALPHADDSSPAGRDGVVQGTSGTTLRTPAVVGDGAALAADNGRLALGTTLAEDAPLTLSGWVTADSTVGGTVLRLEDPAAAGALHAALEVVDNSAGGLAVRASLRDGGGTVRTAEGGTLAVGTQGHVAATWDGTTLTAWLNGVAVASTTVTSRQAGGDVELAIGAGPAAGAAPLDGTVDEVRLDDTARSAAWLGAQVANQSAPAAFATVGAVEDGTWFGTGTWAERTPLTVDAGVVDTSGAGEDLADFPLLVSITVAASAQADGRDLVFTADDGVTRLDHELESWDPGTGALTAWVRVPVLSASLDTGIFLYHGNAAATDQQDPAGVFRSGFTSVHHLADDPEEVAP